MKPGESPFGAKGLVYTGTREFYASRMPGQEAALESAFSEDLREFWGQLFLASGSYDILPIIDISRTAASLVGVSHRDLVMENAQWLAQRDIHGVYRFLLKLASPRQVAVRLPKLSMRYFQFGSADGELQGDAAIRAEQRGVPSPLSDWMLWAVEGFAPVALGTAGAVDVRVLKVSEEPDGEVAGIETHTLRWELHWNTGKS